MTIKSSGSQLSFTEIEAEFGEAINSDTIFTSLGGSNIKPYESNKLASLE